MVDKLSYAYKTIRKLLFSWWNKDLLVFLFFLALSSIFWLMMTLNETFEQEICIPVEMVGQPKDVVMTTEIADTVRVMVRDKGYALVGYKYGNQVKPIKVNFATYANQETNHGIVSASDLQKFVSQRFGSTARVSTIKPDRLEFYFNHGQKKTVPVRLNGHIVPAKSYYLARTQIFPDSITIYASKPLYDSITYVTTEALRVSNFTDTISRSVRIVQRKGVKTDPATVRVVLYPDILTEESVEVPIQAINLPEGKVLRTFPAKATVKFNIGASMFRNIDSRQFSVIVDYNDIAAHPDKKCTLTLKATPHGVRNARLAHPQVDYLIEEQ